MIPVVIVDDRCWSNCWCLSGQGDAEETLQACGDRLMRLGTTNNAQEERLVVLDPRTKLYMLLLFNVIMFSSATGSMAVILKTLLQRWPF